MVPRCTLLFLALACSVYADPFSELWYDGNAEISSYTLTEVRYGEPRTGERVLVFVTEPMRLATHIKPDVGLDPSEMVPVIKLIDSRRFVTGIYDYNVMSSVFAAVEEREEIPLMGTMKVAFTSQEWCGTTMERLVRGPQAFEGKLYSYFESEGEYSYSLPHATTAQAEEVLWILVRTLRGPALQSGEQRTLQIVPSMWSRRTTHEPPALVPAVLARHSNVTLDTPLGTKQARRFTWESGGKQTSVFVEDAYPHRILSWSEPNGSTGMIKASQRLPYWELNRNRDRRHREHLELLQE